MSIKLMSQVWEKDLSHSQQSILLAMADYADDDGRNCYPSYERLAWKTGYSKRNVARIIQELCSAGILVVLKPASQHQSTHYWIRINKAQDKAPFSVDNCDSSQDAELSTLNTDIDNLSTLHNSSMDNLATLNDESDSQRRQTEHSGWTNETSRVDTVSTDPSVNHHIEPTEEKEQTHARDPLAVAWQQAYAGVEMPPKLAASLKQLAAECGIAAAIHGIKASAAKEDGRNFRYIAECARNYVPPAPLASYAQGHTYVVDIPGVVAMTPAVNGNGHAAPATSPPLAHDDPWAIALAELMTVLPGNAGRWLEGSRLVLNGELAGVPLYRVELTQKEANVQWLTQQAEPAVRKKLSGLLRQRILVEFAIDAHTPTVHGAAPEVAR